MKESEGKRKEAATVERFPLNLLMSQKERDPFYSLCKWLI